MTEKLETMQVTEQPREEVERPESSEPENEKAEELTSSIEDDDEPVPHLHAKTFLVVFAVCLIYFAQLVNVVGAGAVSLMLHNVLRFPDTLRSELKTSKMFSVGQQIAFG